ncbi:hypothetical protein ElyMa_004092500, partial [Elysia marginata]
GLSNTEDCGPSVEKDFGKILSPDVTSTHAAFTYQVEAKTHHSHHRSRHGSESPVPDGTGIRLND